MFAFARIFMLVERCTVEASQPVLVLREVGGNPVDDDADTGLVKSIDEVTKIIG